MQDLSLDEISERITNAILADNILTKEGMKSHIRSILKIWIKKADQTKKYSGKNVPAAKLQKTIEQKDFEMRFWKDELKNIVGKDGMPLYYQKIQEALKTEGFI